MKREDEQRRPTFVTQPQGFGRVIEQYALLQEMVESLEERVGEVVTRNEAEFFTAYKNHMERVRRELEELKEKSKNQEKMLSSNDRMGQLEKQIVIFREEALLLYDKLKAKDEQYEELRLKYNDQLRENQLLQEQLRNTLKKHRNLEAEWIMEQQKQPSKEQSQQMLFQLEPLPPPRSTMPIGRMAEENLAKQNTERVKIVARRQNRSAYRAVGETASFLQVSKEKDLQHINQLRQLFEDCVQSAKKAIYRRKALAKPLVKPMVRTDYGSTVITSKKDEIRRRISDLYLQPTVEDFTEPDRVMLLERFCQDGKAIRKMLQILSQ